MGEKESAGVPENTTERVFNLNNGLITCIDQIKNNTMPYKSATCNIWSNLPNQLPAHLQGLIFMKNFQSHFNDTVLSSATPDCLQLRDTWQDFELQKRNIKRNSRQCLVHCWWRHAQRRFWVCWTGSDRIFHISTRNLVWRASALIYVNVLLLFNVLFILRCLELLCFRNIISPLSVTKRVVASYSASLRHLTASKEICQCLWQLSSSCLSRFTFIAHLLRPLSVYVL